MDSWACSPTCCTLTLRSSMIQSKHSTPCRWVHWSLALSLTHRTRGCGKAHCQYSRFTSQRLWNPKARGPLWYPPQTSLRHHLSPPTQSYSAATQLVIFLGFHGKIKSKSLSSLWSRGKRKLQRKGGRGSRWEGVREAEERRGSFTVKTNQLWNPEINTQGWIPTQLSWLSP